MTEIVNIFTVHSATGTLLDVAVSEALKERLRELPPTATYFVVSGQQPPSAVTISVEIARLGKNKVLASVIARLNGADSAVEFVSPVTVNWQPETIAVAERWPSSCSNFFKASELSAIKMLIGGTV